MIDNLFEKLISTLTTLPGIGRKSAQRIAFYLLRMDHVKFSEFIDNLSSIKESLIFCQLCGGITTTTICDICSSEKRDHAIICLVERPEDIFYIENTGEYKGLYHVLNGVISPLDGIGPEQLRIKELLSRISNEVKEIFIATNPTLEGDATASYIKEAIKEIGVQSTRIAYGVSVGSTLEYADRYTLSKAIKARLSMY